MWMNKQGGKKSHSIETTFPFSMSEMSSDQEKFAEDISSKATDDIMQTYFAITFLEMFLNYMDNSPTLDKNYKCVNFSTFCLHQFTLHPVINIL